MTRTQISFRPLFGATLVLLAAGAAYRAHAASSAIGIAVSNGSLHVNRTRVWGNASLFNGTTIETATAPSQIRLDGGARMRLAPGTRVQVFEKKLVMDSGLGEVESAPGFEVEARSLRISGGSADTIARIRLADRKVMVAAVRGSVLVANAAGLLVANVTQGSALDFEPHTEGAVAPTHASGCLLQKAGQFIIAEQTTNVVLELQGAGLGPQVGNRVEITGTADSQPVSVPGASQLVKVAEVKMVAKGGCTAVAKKIGASVAVGAAAASAAGVAGAGGGGAAAGAAAAGAATAAGVGAGTVAVVGGVAAAATVGGLAAVGSLPGQGQDAPPSASR